MFHTYTLIAIINCEKALLSCPKQVYKLLLCMICPLYAGTDSSGWGVHSMSENIHAHHKESPGQWHLDNMRAEKDVPVILNKGTS